MGNGISFSSSLPMATLRPPIWFESSKDALVFDFASFLNCVVHIYWRFGTVAFFGGIGFFNSGSRELT